MYLIEPLGGSEDGQHAVYSPEQLKVGSQPGCGASSNSSSSSRSDREEAPQPAALRGSRSKVSGRVVMSFSSEIYNDTQTSLSLDACVKHENGAAAV